MGITGKYSFTGIQAAALAAIKAAIATTTWGASLLASGVFKFFLPVIDAIAKWGINWLANRGLIVINVGADFFNGEFDQARFDKAIDDGLTRVMQGRDKITPADGKKIDDDVIAATDKFVDFGADPNVVQPNVDTKLQGGRDAPI